MTCQRYKTATPHCCGRENISYRFTVIFCAGLVYIIIRRLEIWNASSAAHMCVWWRESPHRPTSYSSTPFSSLYSVLMESLAFDASKDIHHLRDDKRGGGQRIRQLMEVSERPAYICFDIFSSPLIQTDDKKID